MFLQYLCTSDLDSNGDESNSSHIDASYNMDEMELFSLRGYRHVVTCGTIKV